LVCDFYKFQTMAHYPKQACEISSPAMFGWKSASRRKAKPGFHIKKQSNGARDRSFTDSVCDCSFPILAPRFGDA
jgi:hypothetical protein